MALDGELIHARLIDAGRIFGCRLIFVFALQFLNVLISVSLNTKSGQGCVSLCVGARCTRGSRFLIRQQNQRAFGFQYGATFMDEQVYRPDAATHRLNVLHEDHARLLQRRLHGI